jgi:exopolysaccharide production protein ExoY
VEHRPEHLWPLQKFYRKRGICAAVTEKGLFDAFTTLLQRANTPDLSLAYFQRVQSANVESLDLRLAIIQDGAHDWKKFSIIERVFAGMLLIIVLPVLVIAALLVVVLSRRSPLVAHCRVGFGGKRIWVLKLRTMWTGNRGARSILVERLPVVTPIFPRKTAHDPRVTSRFAAFCRRYSIDELPQLWNVVRGDLALVAPRPLTLEELDTYYGSDAALLLSRKPGLSGLWQINGRSRLTYRQRRRLDLFMIRKWSVPLYFRILILTLPRVLTGKDAW